MGWINQVQSENAPLAISKAGGGGGVGGGAAGNSGSSVVSTSLVNNNNGTGNFSDLGDSPFENNTFMSTTVPIGDTAFLKCTVKNLGNRTISWIRRRDMHIITVDRIVYTNDERFNILHADGSEDWTLQIKFVQKRDNGTYFCDVSSGKGISSFGVHVFVVVPEAFILGNGEYHIQQGSTINLVCIVEKSPKPPEYIFWYHNERMINYGSTRDLSIQTETGSKTQSRLIIENAQVSDSGNYTCETANAEPASTLVYISQGDKMAAIQRRKSDGSSATSVSASASSSSSVNSSPARREGLLSTSSPYYFIGLASIFGISGNRAFCSLWVVILLQAILPLSSTNSTTTSTVS
ncbi:Contactin-3 [Orchesella cincta]|uniref:Contactin-3 n=1 Tax=Orchesella cincta TaxID=48709 RepID=A0A1D2MWU1_ORCCI|nr:Contactin-3 [Orchesella cincta]